jgi:hypothetical protein
MRFAAPWGWSDAMNEKPVQIVILLNGGYVVATRRPSEIPEMKAVLGAWWWKKGIIRWLTLLFCTMPHIYIKDGYGREFWLRADQIDGWYFREEPADDGTRKFQQEALKILRDLAQSGDEGEGWKKD